MKIQHGADSSMPLSGFGPPAVAEPQPGATTITTPAVCTDPCQVQALMTEYVYQTSVCAQIPVVESKKFDLEVSTATGEKLPVWPCPLCTLVGRNESACTHPLQDCHANPQNAECKPPIAHVGAKEIAHCGHPLPACMSTLDLPPDVKAKAAANDPSTQKTVMFA